MVKLKIDTTIPLEHKNRFLRFTPTISSGHIVTAVSIVAMGSTAWAQLHFEVGRLIEENIARKAEIVATIARQDVDRADLYKKIASNHAEVQDDIKAAQKTTHDDLKELQSSLGGRFDRVEDKLDKKQDKR